MTIRQGTSADYAAIAKVSNLAMPEYQLSATQLQRFEDTLDPRCKLGFFVAEDDGQVIGYAQYMQWADVYHPQAFWITVQVHPDHQRQGIGTQLYTTLSDTLSVYDPINFRSSIYDGYAGALAFTQKLGFVEYSRRIDLTCDLDTVDLSQFASAVENARADNFRFVPISKIRNDNLVVATIFDVQWSLELDVPLDETLTRPSLHQWRKEVVDNEMYMGDASFLVMQDEEYVALTHVYKYSDDRLYIEFTGVRPAFRRRGIATAMKVLSMQWGKDNGFKYMGTTNDAVNTGMLAINQQLGFVQRPTRIQIEKNF